MTCARSLCESGRPATVTPGRRDSIVYGLWFCSVDCKAAESQVRKQKRRRMNKLDHETRRARDLRKKYGITVAVWEAMYDTQLGRCALCLTPLAEVTKICVDHDHATGRVRGLLCNNCNHGLGKFQDNAEILRRAAAYVDTDAREREEVMAP